MYILHTVYAVKKSVLASKSDSASPGAIWAQFKPKQLHQKAIPAHAGTYFNQPQVMSLIKGAKLDPRSSL